MIDNKIALKVLIKQFQWYRNEHPFPFVWNDYNAGQKNRYIVEAIALCCQELNKHNLDFRVFVTSFFLNAYDRYKNYDSRLDEDREWGISKKRILDIVRNNYDNYKDFAEHCCEEEKNYVGFVLEPLLEETRKLFNHTFVNELKVAGNKIKDKLNGPFKPLAKFFYQFDDKYVMLYLVAILPENDSKVLSLMLTYNNEKILISSTIHEHQFGFIEDPIKQYPESAFKLSDYKPIWTDSAEWMIEVYKINTFNNQR